MSRLFLYMDTVQPAPCTVSEPQNPPIDEFYLVQKGRAVDFEA